eukprot:1161662-Pelagomonas_calceolata.AAC.16
MCPGLPVGTAMRKGQRRVWCSKRMACMSRASRQNCLRCEGVGGCGWMGRVHLLGAHNKEAFVCQQLSFVAA